MRGALTLAAILLGAAVLRPHLRPGPSAPARDLIAHIDGDGDGVISPAEYQRVSDGDLPFSVLDLDESGAIEGAEVDFYLAHISPLRASLAPIPRVL